MPCPYLSRRLNIQVKPFGRQNQQCEAKPLSSTLLKLPHFLKKNKKQNMAYFCYRVGDKLKQMSQNTTGLTDGYKQEKNAVML